MPRNAVHYLWTLWWPQTCLVCCTQRLCREVVTVKKRLIIIVLSHSRVSVCLCVACIRRTCLSAWSDSHNSLSKFVKVAVWNFDLPLFRPFVTGSDESGWYHMAGESASSTVSAVELSYIKQGWLLLCFVQWNSFSVTECVFALAISVLGAFEKLRKATISCVFYLSVRSPAWNNWTPSGRILIKLKIWAS